MSDLIQILKLLCIIQIIIILIMFISVFSTRIYLAYKKKKDQHIHQQINLFLQKGLQQPEHLDYANIKHSKHASRLLLLALEDFQSNNPNQQCNDFITLLSEQLLIPYARKYSSSFFWLNRYFASIAYKFGFNTQDQANIVKLLQDQRPLIAFNAAYCAMHSANPILINEMLTIFARGRRKQQELYKELFIILTDEIAEIIYERLNQEKNIYVRLFCYQLLEKFPIKHNVYSKFKEDLLVNNTDLKIAVMNYLSYHLTKEVINCFYSLAEDPQWEIRSAAARILSEIKTDKSILILEKLLHDPIWWVRVNAAKSLICQDQAGVAILQKQSPKVDKFAFDAAQSILLLGEQG